MPLSRVRFSGGDCLTRLQELDDLLFWIRTQYRRTRDARGTKCEGLSRVRTRLTEIMTLLDLCESIVENEIVIEKQEVEEEE
jgi:hypothetical protein